MRLRDVADPAAALIQLLDEERTALRAGHLRALPDLATRKERLMDAVVRSRPAPQSVRRLQAAAERNAGLLAACAEGIRAAARMVDAVLSEPEPTQTYTADGRAARLSPPRPRGTTA
ncbi:MAG: flagellar protein FlgN [Rhodobacteraceae bacterium]|jgi:flagellar biosynthesis/type III secretory pathway chaperone|nr:flagellar protein FlgN [Paracoccaceae bacterium]